MRRRSLLGLGGAALTACAVDRQAADPAKRQHHVVVGGGIIGVSIAYQLAKHGQRVTVLEREAVGSGATQGAFALLISKHDGPQHFHDLYVRAIEEWRLFEREMTGAIALQWGGEITWEPPGERAEALKAQTRRLQEMGSPVRLITMAELAELAPGVQARTFGAGAYSPTSGTLDPMQAVTAITNRAKALGAQFQCPREVTGFEVDAKRIAVIQTTSGPIEPDVVIVAAGAQTSPLLEQLGVKTRINVVSGALAHSAPHPRFLNRVLNTPLGSLKQNPDGRIVTGPNYAPGATANDTSEAYGRELLKQITAIAPAAEDSKLETVTLGHVPIPADDFPIVGWCPGYSNLYTCLTMSGITMAPLLGSLAAEEVARSNFDPTLSAYRPDRFAI